MSSTFNELNRYCIGFQWMNMGFVTPKLIFQSEPGPRKKALSYAIRTMHTEDLNYRIVCVILIRPPL